MTNLVGVPSLLPEHFSSVPPVLCRNNNTAICHSVPRQQFAVCCTTSRSKRIGKQPGTHSTAKWCMAWSVFRFLCLGSTNPGRLSSRDTKFYTLAPTIIVGRDSSVVIATGYGLDGPGIESRWGARFTAPVQTAPGAHRASYTMGTGSFPRVKRPGRGVDNPPPLAPRLRKE